VNSYSVPPNTYKDSYQKGDILIQVLCNKTIAQWIVLEVNSGMSSYLLQLIDEDGIFTSKTKIVKGLAINGFIKDAIATKLMQRLR